MALIINRSLLKSHSLKKLLNGLKGCLCHSSIIDKNVIDHCKDRVGAIMQLTVRQIATHGIAIGVAIVLRFLLELFSICVYGDSQDGTLMLLLTFLLYGASFQSIRMYLRES